MNESDMTLLRSWRPSQDVDGWFFSEKLDGCRGYWDGEKLWTRGGHVIPAPDWFTDSLPRGVQLDGELWAGRETLETARRAVQYGEFTDAIRFMVFDAPEVPGNWLERMEAAKRVIAGSRFAKPVKTGRIKNFEHLCIVYFAISGAMGEGLVLRNPEVRSYERGRSYNSVRVKRDPEWG